MTVDEQREASRQFIMKWFGKGTEIEKIPLTDLQRDFHRLKYLVNHDYMERRNVK